MSTSALCVENLSVLVQPHFFSRPRKLLGELSFAVPEGSICAFLGANGAGKTTTLRCILGLLRPDGGSIELFGKNVSERTSRVGLGYLPERPAMPMELTAREFVTSHARLSGLSFAEAHRAADRALEEVSLSDARERRLKTFSKGMLQRTGLAQVIAGNPRFLILDEPLSGLDPRGRHDVRKIIAQQRKLGRTVLFSTHVLADVALLCDQVLIIANGRLIHRGTPKELEAKAQTFASELEVATELIADGDLTQLAALAEEHRRLAVSDIFSVSSEKMTMRLVDELRRRSYVIKSITPIGGGLEQLFIDADESKKAVH